MRVLVYVDSPSMVSSGSAIGRALRDELDAEILLLVVDSLRHRDALPRDFTIHDYAELFSSPTPKRETFPKRMRGDPQHHPQTNDRKNDLAVQGPEYHS